MLETEATDVTVTIEYNCPECGKLNVSFLGREPDRFDADCEECGITFTVKC